MHTKMTFLSQGLQIILEFIGFSTSTVIIHFRKGNLTHMLINKRKQRIEEIMIPNFQHYKHLLDPFYKYQSGATLLLSNITKLSSDSNCLDNNIINIYKCKIYFRIHMVYMFHITQTQNFFS